MRTSRRQPTNPVPYQGKLTIANAITDVTRLAGVQGDGAAYPDSSVGVWTAATNLCTNGGFETDTTGWSARGTSPSIARTAAESKFGSASLAVTIGTGFQSDWGATFDNSSNYISVTGGSTYTASVWVKSNGSKTVKLRVFERNGAKAVIGSALDGGNSSSSAWSKLVFTATANASAAYWQIIVGVGSAADISFTFYLDGVQLEPGSIATPYIETDGGTASRSAGLVTIPNSIIDETQMWVALRAKMGWSQAAESTLTTVSFLWNCRDSANEGLLYYYDRPSDSMVLRRDSGGVGTENAKNATGLWAQGDDTSFCAQITASGLSQSIAGSVFTAATANATIPTLSAPLSIGADFTAGREPMAAFRWVAIGKGILTDADAALFHAWGNNDPLPHQFPPSAQLSFLAHFNGDGTFYRRSA